MITQAIPIGTDESAVSPALPRASQESPGGRDESVVQRVESTFQICSLAVCVAIHSWLSLLQPASGALCCRLISEFSCKIRGRVDSHRSLSGKGCGQTVKFAMLV